VPACVTKKIYMKYLSAFFIFFCFNLTAQVNMFTETDTLKKGLSPSELQTAKNLYILMMQTDDYKNYKRSMRDMNIKLQGLQLPSYTDPDVGNDLVKIRKITELWLKENISKTQFASVKEGTDTIVEVFALLKKRIEDHKEVYDLMRKAEKSQVLQIIEPERNANRQGKI